MVRGDGYSVLLLKCSLSNNVASPCEHRDFNFNNEELDDEQKEEEVQPEQI